MSDAPAPHLQELHPFLGLEWHMSENVCDGQERDLGGAVSYTGTGKPPLRKVFAAQSALKTPS